MDKRIIIWGAGKIGRGFIAELFQQAGYSLIFVDKNKALIDSLNSQKSYAIHKCQADGGKNQTLISAYTALHVSQEEAISAALNGCALMALSVLPENLEEWAGQFAAIVRERMAAQIDAPLDVLICANMVAPAAKLRKTVEAALTESETKYFRQQIGLVETLVTRAAMNPTDDIVAQDPLAVVTNDYPTLPVDKGAFKGIPPQSESIVLTDNMQAQVTRKIYTYNMVHAVYAYLGYVKGYTLISECHADEEIRETAVGALKEVEQALSAAFGFSKQEMDEWMRRTLDYMSHQTVEDTVERVGADPIRKLEKHDRLTGPALLCKDHGVWPYYLTKAIAHAFLFNPNKDVNAQIVKEYADYYGIKEAAKKYCGLDMEPELLELIRMHHDRAVRKERPESPEKVAVMQQAYHLGFISEKAYRGCAQCTLQGLFRLTGKTDEKLFQSASGFSGGMGISGDGVCGGYSGGIMYMSSKVGRRLKEMAENGDKDAQYMSYMMAQRLRDHFIQTYGSVICGDVHKQIFGRSYCLRTKAVRNEFESVGAHTSKCTNVVGTACAYIAGILYDTGYLDAEERTV